MKRLWKTLSIGVGVFGLMAMNLISPTHFIITGARIPLKGQLASAQGLGWTSANWSGYALASQDANSFQSINGSWQVPTVHASSQTTSSFGANWIGIDGFNNSHLIQTGTGEQVINGAVQYFSWWEILPQTATLINMVVQPGNTMHASIINLGSGVWQITIQNVSLHESFTTEQTYSGPAQSAEWIQERPQINGSLSTLDPYSTFDFSNLTVNGSNPKLTAPEGGVMIQHGVQVSTPSYPSVTENSFAMAYGSQMPMPPSVVSPHIYFTQPYLAGVGQTLRIMGSGFGTSMGQVTIGGVPAKVSGWSPSLITVTVPTVASGPQLLTVTTATGSSASRTVDVTQPQSLTPTIVDAFPNPAFPGAVVRLTGRNFGNVPGSVTIENTAAHIDSWSPYMVTFTVPTSATPETAPITLTTAQGTVATDSNFSVESGPSPAIRGVYPSAAQVGQMVRIYGSNFGASQGSVTVGGTSARIQSWSPYFITVVVPSVSPGTEPVVVTTASGSKAEDASFQVIAAPAPSIHSALPNPAQVGQVVRVFGSNLGMVPGTITVGGVKATIQSWSPYFATFVVPNVPSGSEPLVLTTSTGQSAQLNTFSVATAPAPHISTAYPNPAVPGMPLRIMGSNFGTAQGQVTINGIPVSLEYWSPYFIDVIVPSGLASGTATLTVTTASGQKAQISLSVK